MSVETFPHASSRHVLIVDDDSAILDVYEMAFSDLGFIPIVTSDAALAIEKAVAFRPALIILDQQMPAKTGLEIARELRSKVACSTPIVLVSAGRDLAREALAAGATVFIEKPFDIDHLIDVVLSQTDCPVALTA